MHTARKSYVVREEILTKDVKIESGGSISFVNKKGVVTNLDLEALSTFTATDVADTKVVTVSGTLAGVSGTVSPSESLALKVDLLIGLIKDTANPLGSWWTALTPPLDPATESDSPIAGASGSEYIYKTSSSDGGLQYANHHGLGTLGASDFSSMFQAFVTQTDLDITNDDVTV